MSNLNTNPINSLDFQGVEFLSNLRVRFNSIRFHLHLNLDACIQDLEVKYFHLSKLHSYYTKDKNSLSIQV
jgi:hypothetical protein